jgi:glycosyltransferase involved in cell wall biosynthesis
MARRLRFLFLEPFYGGSHRDFADGLIAHSRHRIDLMTLPDRFWKWRMRGAALYFLPRIKDPGAYDGLIVSSLMSLTDLKALWPGPCPPALVYFHENQLSYPLAPGEQMDYQFGFTNIATAAAAQRLLFNSETHLKAFTSLLPGFLHMMPDCRPTWLGKAISDKAAVAYPGCHFSAGDQVAEEEKDNPPLIIWNHRWEHDKNPDAFFQALSAMQQSGRPFRVALLGETYGQAPESFGAMQTLLGHRLAHCGYVPSRQGYYQWLKRGAIVVSTSLQENFGIAVIEAMRHGCLPLLPRRLSYPEILPQAYHDTFLYSDQADLVTKLGLLLDHPVKFKNKARFLGGQMGEYAWESRIAQFDRELDNLAVCAG